MKELVILQNNQAITTSLKVAEHFEKEHFNVIRDIEALMKKIASVSQPLKLQDAKMFEKADYQAEEGGRRYPMYLMNRDGFMLLAMGFTGAKALQFKLDFIDAFDRMEQVLKGGYNVNGSLVESVNKLADVALRLVKALEKRETPRRKKDDLPLYVPVKVMASELGISVERVQELLAELGYQFKDENGKWTPTAKGYCYFSIALLQGSKTEDRWKRELIDAIRDYLRN